MKKMGCTNWIYIYWLQNIIIQLVESTLYRGMVGYKFMGNCDVLIRKPNIYFDNCGAIQIEINSKLRQKTYFQRLE